MQVGPQEKILRTVTFVERYRSKNYALFKAFYCFFRNRLVKLCYIGFLNVLFRR